MKKETVAKVLLSLVVFLFVGCGEEKQETPQQTAKIEAKTEQTKAPQIEIVQNSNPKEIKVAAKKKRDRNATGTEDRYYYDYNIKSAYDPNSVPANKDASIRVKPRTAVEANMNVRSPYEEVQISLLVGKLSKNFIVKCSACHSDYANGVIGPSLLSKTSDEIFDNIQAFKSGAKSNVLMDDLINMMSSEEIRALADEIYEFNEKIKEARK